MSDFDLFALNHLDGPTIQRIHDEVLESSTGLKGNRSGMTPQALEGRIQQTLFYNPPKSLAEVAALYAEVVARGHVFLDGNKRTAFTCMVVFLAANNVRFILSNNLEISDWIVDLAEGRKTRHAFANWLNLKLA